MRVDLQLQHKLHLAMSSIKDHAAVGMALINNRHAFHRDIEVAVVRATSHGGGTVVDDKYVHQILFLVSNDPKCALFLADRLTWRLHKNKDIMVALKTLVLVHRLLRGGNGWFEKRLRSAHGSGHLQIQLSSHHIVNNPAHVVSHFMQKYICYIEKRMEWGISQAGKLEPVAPASAPILDYCDVVLHKIIKGQELLDRTILLDSCSVTSILGGGGGDQSCLQLLLSALSHTLKESFEVYRAIWEGINFIVSEVFELTRNARARACRVLKKASEQNEKIWRFYRECKRIIDSKQLDFPCVNVITMDHIAALEQLHSSDSEPIRLHVSAGKKERHIASNNGSLSDPFSLTKETKISKVWVVFDEQEEPADRPVPFCSRN